MDENLQIGAMSLCKNFLFNLVWSHLSQGVKNEHNEKQFENPPPHFYFVKKV